MNNIRIRWLRNQVSIAAYVAEVLLDMDNCRSIMCIIDYTIINPTSVTISRAYVSRLIQIASICKPSIRPGMG